MKNILFIGDIFGRPGRSILKEAVPKLIESMQLDFVIANGENAAGGAGITKKICEEIHEAGVDGITLGDHVWDQHSFDKEIDDIPFVCRPGNLPKVAPGRRYLVLEKNGFRLAFFTMLGQVFMKIKADCPFRASDNLLNELSGQYDTLCTEIHAEATAEKATFGWYLDGKAALVAGTHTHVPTADARLLHNNTAFITDVGMTGPYDSIIGSVKETILERAMDGIPRRFSVARDNVQLHGCRVSIDEATGLARHIEKVTYVRKGNT